MPATAPKTERGTQTQHAHAILPGWGHLAAHDDTEYVPELAFPASVQTYERMRNDSQIDALYTVLRLAVQRRRWQIDPNGADPRHVAHVAAALGLPVQGEDAQPRGRRRGRFSWHKHLEHALLALLFGFYPFEQVGQIEPDGLWHLRKLAPRPPRTIGAIEVEPDGGLKGVRQLFQAVDEPSIPASQLVMYVWGQEGAAWTGRSMLRALYRDWLLKDRLLRVDALKHERNGMGVPVTRETERDVGPAARRAAQDVASSLRAGQEAGAHLPHGIDLDLKGVTGSLPDTLASIRRADEAMARAFFGQVAMLGSGPNGSRALGDVQLDLLTVGVDAICGWVCDTAGEHVIEDIVDWNFGEDVQDVPLLVAQRDDDPELDVAGLTQLVQAGALTVDDALEDDLRSRYGLAERSAPRPPVTSATASPSPTRSQRTPPSASVAAAATVQDSGLSLPDARRRDPYPHEVAAAVDFEALAAVYGDDLNTAVAQLAEARAAQRDELVAQIEAADGDLAAIAQITATAGGAAALTVLLRAAARRGRGAAAAEARAQGAAVPDVDLDALDETLGQRADARAILLAQQVAGQAASVAVQATGQGLAPPEVAARVGEHLDGLTDTTLRDAASGLLTAAQNEGRVEVMRVTDPVRVYASALLDEAGCEACVANDGTEYPSVEEGERDFPAGLFLGCQGGERCRCTLVAVHDEAEATVDDA